ncbi:MAG: hypothetical protein GKR95_02715 [Gammaproteobacteria bacterium]|nr:hypothetical protein [Gammaproteobacteria bacterium]
MYVYTISDLHVDYPANRQWLDSLSETQFQQDVLILPGDISDDRKLLSQVFNKLKSCFFEVIYVPGNHDLWVPRDQTLTSLKKFEEVLDLADSMSVVTGVWSHEALTIVPLFSWYDYSFGSPCEWLRRSWMDYYLCNWEEFSDEAVAVTDFFLSKNESRLSVKNHHVISCSHFLPRLDLMPDHIPFEHQRVYPVLGSWKLDQQIRQLGSNMHIYGHSHVNRDVTLEGIHYINNAFGNPKETRIAKKKLQRIY